MFLEIFRWEKKALEVTGTHFNKRRKLGSSDVISVFTTELQLSALLVLQCGVFQSCERIVLIEYG